MNYSIFKRTFLFIFLAEILSFIGYLLSPVNQAVFFVIAAAALVLSLYNLKYGVWMALAELFIGSKGYLFYFTAGGLVVSIRIALWIIIMSVWFAGLCKKFVQTKKVDFADEAIRARKTLLPYFFLLFAVVCLGALNGLLRGNPGADIFFDFNGWLYLTLLLPVYRIVFAGTGEDKKAAERVRSGLSALGQVFAASVIWLSFKTFFLIFIFSHDLESIAPAIYRWVRESGVGEITRMEGGFYRIFFQSHIFALAGFLIFLFVATRYINRERVVFSRYFMAIFAMISILLSVNLISFSRSNWAGLIFGIIPVVAYQLWMTKKKRFKKLSITMTMLAASLVLSIGIIAAIVKFPYPGSTGNFNTGLLSERAGQVTGEAGVSSRWNLLPPLAAKIVAAPVLGQGFGATVTYRTNDPRILASSANGEYTTYAFEWGWLDIWLKTGIIGIAAYLLLLVMIFKAGISVSSGEENAGIVPGMLIGLAAIIVVNFFSPYLNHPLGLGYIILCAVTIDGLKSAGIRKRISPAPQPAPPLA